MSVQKELMNRIKMSLPEHISFVDELADLLNVSNDSAYRRIRGETPLSLDELVMLSQRFKVSVDSVLGYHNANRISFRYTPIDEKQFPFQQYLDTLNSILYNFTNLEDTQLIYAANEAQFILFHVPEVAIFKLFFWMKTAYGFEEAKSQKFDFDEYLQIYGSVINDIVKNYVKIPTIEIINGDYLNSTLNQIRFYNDSGYFKSGTEAKMLCDKLIELILHNKREAELGYKFLIGKPEVGQEGNLMLYHNEIIHSDNVISARVKNEYFCHLLINTINFMITRNQKFARHTHEYLINLKNKSSLISVSAEKERNRFYQTLIDKVNALKSNLG
jgi:transcriptional regulator with XRE-family HTH domain